jgi:recombination protein RecA
VKVIKNKLAPPFREAEFDIRWGTGVDRAGELIDLGVEMGLLKKAGAFLSLDGESLGQGREKAREHVLKTEGLREKLMLAVGRIADSGPSRASEASEDVAA